MADYDWFTPTDAQLRESAAHAKALAALHFAEVGYHKETLVCTLCGAVIYGRFDDKYARLHRERCFAQHPSEGKHKA